MTKEYRAHLKRVRLQPPATDKFPLRAAGPRPVGLAQRGQRRARRTCLPRGNARNPKECTPWSGNITQNSIFR